jgi:DNA-binding response OmpR family regulator
VYLPALEDAAKPVGSLSGNSTDLRGKETILLVEDDTRVLSFSRTALKAYGYNVLGASDPLTAIKVSEGHAGIIHLLVTDVVMPQLNGRRLAEILSAARPELDVLYVSGYTDDAIVRQGILESEVSFLQKPFTPQALAAKVRSILGRRAVIL